VGSIVLSMVRIRFERAMVVSYRPYALNNCEFVTIALSLAIRPQFAVECLRRSNQRGVGHFGVKFVVFNLDEIRDVGVCRDSNTPG